MKLGPKLTLNLQSQTKSVVGFVLRGGMMETCLLSVFYV